MKELIDCKGERFEYETRMLLECAGRYKITEVPIKTVYDSKENHQTHFDPFKDSIRIYKILGVKFVKYMFASISSFVIDILLFTLFCHLLKDIVPEGFLIQVATVCARLISATYNYIINYSLVFKSRAGKGTALAKYAALAFVQMQASAWSVAGICFLLPMVSKTLIKCIVDTILFLLSYSIQQRFVFASKKRLGE
jgi:putative flippase GtrA